VWISYGVWHTEDLELGTLELKNQLVKGTNWCPRYHPGWHSCRSALSNAGKGGLTQQWFSAKFVLARLPRALPVGGALSLVG
jgi:hypothetical protein